MKLTLEGMKTILREQEETPKGHFTQIVRYYHKYRRAYMKSTRDKQDVFFEKDLLLCWPRLLLDHLREHPS